MTDPNDKPFTEAEIDWLLSRYRVEPFAPDLLDRIAAEARRPDRRRTAPPLMRQRRGARRHWARRRLVIAFVAVNLIAASAIAAAFGGGGVSFAKLAHFSAHVLALAKAELPRPFQGHHPRHVPHVARTESGRRSASAPPPALAVSAARVPPETLRRDVPRVIAARPFRAVAMPLHRRQPVRLRSGPRPDRQAHLHRHATDAHRPGSRMAAPGEHVRRRIEDRQPPAEPAMFRNGRGERRPGAEQPLHGKEAPSVAERQDERREPSDRAEEPRRDEGFGRRPRDGWQQRPGWRERGVGRPSRPGGGRRRRRWF